MYITTTETRHAHFAQRKRLRRRSAADGLMPLTGGRQWEDPDDNVSKFLHAKQMNDLLTWHIGVLGARWYVKPRSTCWFEEYLFKIYTLEMFYEILRMRRRTFDRLVHDLRLFIQGQHTHWRAPISVEKKW
jgi:hypothetical protein